MKPDYDAIGERFEQFADTAAQRAIEVRTMRHMMGDMRGKSVLDLACGYGYFAREAHRMGASRVVGVDVSETMIDLARQESKRNGDGIEFHVRNVSDMETLGTFDVVTAAWLFNYAQSTDELRAMFKAVAANMAPSGRLVVYTVEPDFALRDGNFDTYGVNVLNEEAWDGGFRHEAEFVTNPPSRFTFYRWSREDYERAIDEAGFASFEWHKPLLLEEDLRQYKPGFWDTYQSNCLQTGLVCKR